MKREIIYRVGDTVYFLFAGDASATKGVVKAVGRPNPDESIVAEFIHDSSAVLMPFDEHGKLDKWKDSVLSFTPYNIHTGGFSQERPKPEIKKGQLAYVRNRIGSEWEMRFFSHYDEHDDLYYFFDEQKKSGTTSPWYYWQLENPLVNEENDI